MNIQRALFRRLWLPFYRIYALRYVQQRRVWRSHGLRLSVPPGVFHPGIYFSTPFFLDFLQQQNFAGKTVFDIGTGSGALAIFAAQKGGVVYAVDINAAAVETARENARTNHVAMEVLQSDLFAALPNVQADYVLVNPPYYPKNPGNDAEYAFFAGEGLTYFRRFFKEILPFCHEKTAIWMVLSEDCDWHAIQQFAQKEGFSSAVVAEKKHWGERLFIGFFIFRCYAPLC